MHVLMQDPLHHLGFGTVPDGSGW